MYYKSINWMRGIAIVFVVLGHVNYGQYVNARGAGRFFYDGTLIFVFISGFLFFHLIARYDFASYMRKKLHHVIIPYLFVTIPVCLLSLAYYATDRKWLNDVPDFDNAIYLYTYQITTGATLLNPLWFVPMITIFFLLSPLLHKTMQSRHFGAAVILTMAFTMTSTRPGALSPALSFVHWLGIYLFGGYCCKHYGLLVKNKYPVLIASLTGLAVFHYSGGHTGFINSPHLHKILLTFMFIALFSILETRVERIGILDALAHYSFGIFLLHGYFIGVYNLFLFRITGGGIGPILFIAVSCLVFPVLIIRTFHWMTKGVNINPKLFFGV